MSVSFLCDWFQDWGNAIKNGLGQTGLIIMLVVLGSLALLITWNILKASLGKAKIKILWGQIVLLIIIILFLAWFFTLV